MLPAPLKLDQQRESRIGSSQANNLSIKQTDIADGKTYPETYEKVWGDPMASKSMPDKLYLITNGGAKVDLNYTINNPVPLETGDITLISQAERVPLMQMAVQVRNLSLMCLLGRMTPITRMIW